MTMISGGGAVMTMVAMTVGVWAAATPTAQPARTAEAQKTLDVTQYGAAGKRGDSSTKAIQDAHRCLREHGWRDRLHSTWREHEPVRSG